MTDDATPQAGAQDRDPGPVAHGDGGAAIAAAREAVRAAFNVARDALRQANPDLPAAVFDNAEDLADLQRRLDDARAIADHVRAQTPASSEAGQAITPAGAGAARADERPAGLRGLDRIRYGLREQE